ncbi:arsenate reductase family protein [Indiicoccus explosivorum]|uniref:arsenate reductase family protein n=1 Tax=Indiicoccus explosivorum TaxID=1917864 RepID=UPI000B4317DD|nr:arsenate reductase family protein [Indiicoccus explosivorum]
MLKFYTYPSCSTCKKAKKWLEENGIPYNEIDIVKSVPGRGEIRTYWKNSGLELKKLFNTSGVKYRELGLKDRLPELDEEEQLTLLASDGKLLKRPIAADGKGATFGFKETVYEKTWK